MKRNKLFIAGMSVLLAVSFSGCSKKSASSVAEEEKPETIFAVNVYKAVPKKLDDYLSFGGNVQTASNVDIYPDVQSGKISKIFVKVGDKVKKTKFLQKSMQAVLVWITNQAR